jgi:hypothetical protein
VFDADLHRSQACPDQGGFQRPLKPADRLLGLAR